MKSDSRVVSATAAARNFSDLLNRVEYRGEEFTITRGKKVIARITPEKRAVKTVADLRKAWASRPRLDPEDAELWLKEIEEQRKLAPMPPSPWD